MDFLLQPMRLQLGPSSAAALNRIISAFLSPAAPDTDSAAGVHSDRGFDDSFGGAAAAAAAAAEALSYLAWASPLSSLAGSALLPRCAPRDSALLRPSRGADELKRVVGMSGIAQAGKERGNGCEIIQQGISWRGMLWRCVAWRGMARRVA